MDLKRVFTEEEFKQIPEPMKALYDPKDGNYVMRLADYVDPTPLLNAKQREKDENKRLREEKAKIEARLMELESEVPVYKEQLSQKDVDLKRQLDELTDKFNKKELALKQKAENALIDRVATEVADLFESKTAGKAIARQRIKIEEVNGDPVAIYLDENGNKILGGFEEFKKKLVEDEDLKPIIKGVRSSGGSATSSISTVSNKSFKDMTATEKAILANTNPAEYQRLSQSK